MDTILYYIHDPMCSWCYAFESSFNMLQQALPSSIKVIKLVGGLAPDTTETMPKQLQQSIQKIWYRIEQTVPNVQFNHDFWSMNTPMRSTYLACRAVLSAKKQYAEDEMITAIQTAYYQKAQNPSLQSTLIGCAADIGLNVTEFENDLKDMEIERQLQSEISMARNFNVMSYPSLRLKHNGKVASITLDYLNHETMYHEILKMNIN
jgi:putative protein-disulfide isomerase